MPTKPISKAVRLQRNERIIKGLKATCPKAQVPINGTVMKSPDIVKLFERASELEEKVFQSHAQYLADVKAAREIETRIRPMIQPIKGFVQNTFGAQSEEAASFGFQPRKVTKLSVKERLETVEKIRATRAARHTMGPRQKDQIHGDDVGSARELHNQQS